MPLPAITACLRRLPPTLAALAGIGGDALSDAGQAGAATRTFAAAADTYTRSDQASTNFGTSERFSAMTGPPVRRAYLRFVAQIPEGSVVTRATLQLSTTTSADHTGVDLHGVADDAWDEKTLTYNNAPAHGAAVSGTGSFARDSRISLDATALVAGSGPVSMALTSRGEDYRAFDSRETGGGPRLVVETTPETTITGGPVDGGSFPDQTFTLEFRSNEAGSSFTCRIDEEPWQRCSSPQPLTGLADGTHTFEVRAVDLWGITDPTPARRAWMVDTGPPETRLSHAPLAVTNDPDAELDFDADEPAATFECRLDDAAFTACAAPAAYAGLGDGAHRFEVRALDTAGNADPTPAGWSWTVDTVAPAPPTLATPADGTVVAVRDVLVAGQAEPDSRIEVFDGGVAAGVAVAEAGGAWSLPVEPLNDGMHELTAVATDLAGNVSLPSAAHRVTVDTVAPESTITSGPTHLSKVASSPSFAFSASEAGVTFQCRRDGKSFSSCTSPKRYSSLPDGIHTFEVRAVDVAGNVDPSPATWTWTVDATPPSVRIAAPATGTVVTRDGTVSIAVEASDPAGIARIEFWDGTVRRLTTYAEPHRYVWKVSASKAGRHHWTVRAYDAAGNRATTEPVQVDVNLVAATVETDPVPDDGDAADDPAVWIHPVDPSLSTIIATDKYGGLAVYDLAGRQLHFYADSRPNNVDVRYGFSLAGRPTAIVATTDRATDTMRLYRVDPATRGLIAMNAVPTGPGLYGLCLYRSAATGLHYAFVTYDDGTVRQSALQDGGTTVSVTEVRSFRVPGFRPAGDQITEGCVADDALGAFYVAEEDAAIWRYGAEPLDTTPPVAVDVTGPGGHLVPDVEGLAIYPAPAGEGYLLASSQGSDELVVYERSGDNRYVERFGVGIGVLDRASDSDGLEVVALALGSAFPEGLLVVHDGYNPLHEGGDRQNFKLVPWGGIARALGIPLLVDTRWDPRVGAMVP